MAVTCDALVKVLEDLQEVELETRSCNKCRRTRVPVTSIVGDCRGDCSSKSTFLELEYQSLSVLVDRRVDSIPKSTK